MIIIKLINQVAPKTAPFMKPVLLSLFLLISLATADKYQSGFQKVKVQIATVLDGYYKEFEGVICHSGSQFFIWHEKSQSKSLKDLLGDTPVAQVGLNGAVMGLSLQKYIPELILNEQSIVIAVKPEIQKATTIKIEFLSDEIDEQEEITKALEAAFEAYEPMDNTRFEYAALKHEGNFIQYVKRVHDDL